MDQGDGALAVGVLEVGVELAQLAHQEHALVDDGPAGEGGNVGVDIGLLKHPADHIELAVKGQALLAAVGPLHEALADDGHAGAGLFTQHLRMGGHIPPAQEGHALLGHDDLQHLLGLGPPQRVGGEEEHTHAVIPLAAQADALGGGCLHHELVGHLEHDAHAVAGLAGGVLAGAVLQLFHDFQRVVHSFVCLDALQADHGADAAGVVLQLGVIEHVVSLVRFQHWNSSHSFY